MCVYIHTHTHIYNKKIYDFRKKYDLDVFHEIHTSIIIIVTNCRL